MEILGKDTANLLRDDKVRAAVYEILDHRKDGTIRESRRVEVCDNTKGKSTVSVKEAVP